MTGRLPVRRRVLVPATVTALSAAVAVELGLLYQLTRRYGRALQQLDDARESAAPPERPPVDPRARLFRLGAPPGSVGMNFDLPALDGSRASLLDWSGQRVLLVFIAPDCPGSEALLAGLATLPPEPLAGRPQIVLISTGDPERTRALVARHGVRHPVLLQERNEVSLIYFVSGTPMAYVLDGGGATEVPSIDGAQAILGVAFATVVGGGQVPDPRTSPTDRTPGQPLAPVRRGERLPPFRLPALGGGELSDVLLSGRRTFLVLFDPRCAPCLDLLPELARTHSDPRGPDVVVVTRRDPELTRALARERPMPYPIAVQPHRSYSRRLGVLATPAACLVGPDGVLESDVVVGQQAVTDLTRRQARDAAPRRLVALASLLGQR